MIKLITLSLTIFIFCEYYYAQGAGNALLFDGVDDYVNFGNSPVFNVDTAVTYEMWIRPDTSVLGWILNKWVGFQQDFQLTFGGGGIGFYFYNVFGSVPLQTASVIPLNQYSHIAATYNGSTAAIYINGKLDTSKSVGSFPGISSGNLFMGSNPDRAGAEYPFKGAIDEFRIWNTARNETEIISSMHQELEGNEPGLIGYWNFNEGIDTIAADKTNNGNDGIINGAAWIVSGITLPVENESVLPDKFRLSQNYPNPFNPTTTIQYSISQLSSVTLKVYDVLGNEIAILINEEKERGVYMINFHASDFASGIYFYELREGNFVTTRKMILIK